MTKKTTKPEQTVEQILLSKDVLGMLINLVASHRNQWPQDETATAIHALLAEAWNRAEWLPETKNILRKARVKQARAVKT